MVGCKLIVGQSSTSSGLCASTSEEKTIPLKYGFSVQISCHKSHLQATLVTISKYYHLHHHQGGLVGLTTFSRSHVDWKPQRQPQPETGSCAALCSPLTPCNFTALISGEEEGGLTIKGKVMPQLC